MQDEHKPFGEILVDKKVIERDQLEKVLAIQKENPQRTIGEIVSATYGIPMEDIEKKFVDFVLVPAIKRMLTDHLIKEAEKHSQENPFSIDQLVFDISVVSIILKRIISSSFVENGGAKMKMVPGGRQTSTEIGGKLRLSIKTKDDKTLCEPTDMFSYVYEFESGKAQLKTGEMEGIRFLFSRKLREEAGDLFVFQPVSQDEIEDALKQL